MIFKILFFTLFSLSVSLASVQEVRIGTIDNYYSDKISTKELKKIIDEIEVTLESQVGFDLFNYSKTGKPIDIIYMPPLKLEEKIAYKMKVLKKKKEKIEEIKRFFPDEKNKIKKYQKNLHKFALLINKMTKEVNNYVQKANRQRNFTSAEYKNAQLYVKTKQNRIDRDIKNLRKERRSLRRMIDKYNKKIYRMNVIAKESNRLSNQINKMSRSIKKIKGRTFGLKELTLKTYYKDGKKVKEKTVKNSMTKIEIYGFDSLQQLKAVIAHEIGHLVGIPHINTKNALMHPFLQKNQIENLFLIEADIKNFKRNF